MKALKHKKIKKIHIFIYILLSIIFFELYLNIVTVNVFNLDTIIISLIFILSLSLAVYGFSILFKERLGFIIISINLFLMSLIYVSQIIYYKVFKTYYTVYSLLNSKQVLEYKNTGIAAIIENSLNIIIIFLPFLIFLVFHKSFYNKKNVKIGTISLILAVVIHLAGVGAIYLTPHDSFSVFDFYFNRHGPKSTVENLGLMNYMRLDIKNNIFENKVDVVENPPINFEAPIVEESPTADG